jgi:glycosyltransferase involved in cell wall biosynthesis
MPTDSPEPTVGSGSVRPMAAAPEVAGGGDGPRTLVVIPAFNEQDALPKALADLRANASAFDVVVVDDGSVDATATVATAEGAVCLQLPFNLGIGGALRTGFRYAVEMGYERALQFDADGQHDAGQISILLAELDAGADMVVGSRFAGEGDYKVGRSRGLAMRILRWAIARLAGKRFSDTSSGFRAFGPDVLRSFAADYPIEYMDSVEALVLACRAGYDVREVPVVMHERVAGQASNRRFRLAYHYVRVLVVLATSKRIQGPGSNPEPVVAS